jgi:fatty acid-binding protein DegV
VLFRSVCPLIINVGEDGKVNSYKDDIEIFNKELCEKLVAGLDVKTSQPSPGETLILLEKLSTEYEQVFCLPITPTISGTYGT